MLSVLIPIYNFDSRELVQDVHTQCVKGEIYFEIICFDDCSKPKFHGLNRQIGSLVNVSYIELTENKGRAKIRNLLAKNARHDHLLFLDCDSKIISKKFIKTYLKYLPDNPVINGGRVYAKSKPKATSKLLHWTYGKQRESGNIKRRQKYPDVLFHSNNFVIKRELMLQYPLDESIDQYGYEDLVFAHKLNQAGVPIMHIENHVKHGSLEKTEAFLSKTEQSIQNIAKLYKANTIMRTPLIKSYEWLNKQGLINQFQWFYRKIDGRIMKSLRSEKPNMYAYDLFKLNLFINNSKSI